MLSDRADFKDDNSLNQVADPEYKQSGAYWSWENRQKKDGKSFPQKVYPQARDDKKCDRLGDLRAKPLS